jgi:hypothetical protein
MSLAFCRPELNLHHGLGYTTPMPEGWRLIEHEKGFAEAVDTDGNHYYLAPDKAYLRKKALIHIGTLNPGDEYIDTANPIPLNRREPSPEVSQRVLKIADDYIANAWPDGCPATVAIEIRLAIYAGMYSCFEQIEIITEKHGENEETACDELEEVRLAVLDRALTLNRERQSI